MEKKVGEIFVEKYFTEFDGKKLQCVEDGEMCDCSDCVFFDGCSCPTKVVDKYPCYHSDRSDGKDVHYIEIHS